MPHSNTQFDQGQIEQMAQQHEALASDVQRGLQLLGGEIDATLAGASNDMTVALQNVYREWSEGVNKAVLEGVGLMAQAMRAEAGNQETSDQDNTRQIMNTSSPVQSYLGR